MENYYYAYKKLVIYSHNVGSASKAGWGSMESTEPIHH